jgi:hypothetical protein
MSEKPKLLFRNLSEAKTVYAKNHRLNSASLKQNEFPCIACNGSGRVRNKDDWDPVEGYKLTQWYHCAGCDGTGVGDKAQFKAWMDRQIQSYKQELEQWKLRQRALRKLTMAEKQVLNLT